MGVNRLFISQDLLDQWVDDGKATVDSDCLVLSEEPGAFQLEPALLFLREAAGADDPHDLVGRVKEQARIEEIGGEAYMDSVILEDNAYDVKTGFVAIPESKEKAADVEGPTEQNVALDPDLLPRGKSRDESVDSAELADLLLKHLK